MISVSYSQGASAGRAFSRPALAFLLDTFQPGGQQGDIMAMSRALSALALAGAALAPQPAVAETGTRLGDSTLRVRQADLDVRPRLEDGKLGLKVKGEFLDSELSRQMTRNDGSTVTQGLRGRVHGEHTTFGTGQAWLNLEAFRRWEMTVMTDRPALFEVSAGVYQDLAHNTTRVGFQMRQEINGGSFSVLGQPLSWAAEGRQSSSYRVQGNSAEPANRFDYSVLVGVRRDFETTLVGKKATISVTIGPELRGDSDTSVELRPRAKVRVRF
ncbi:hypothetical protein DYH09_26015 [bacterium CPR1]|nr:hypothetical protein [bacterium CPR1]